MNQIPCFPKLNFPCFILQFTYFHSYSLSELPECQVPLSMRTDVIDQTLGIALHPAYDSKTAIVSASMILCLVQSPEAHVYIARKEVVENMLEMCELKHKMVDEPSSQSQQGEKEDPMAVNALKYVTLSLLSSPPPTPFLPHSSLFFLFFFTCINSLPLFLFLSPPRPHTLSYNYVISFYSGATQASYWLR